MTVFDDGGSNDEPWKQEFWSPDLTPEQTPVAITDFDIAEEKSCQGCGDMQCKGTHMHGVRIGFAYNEVCDACWSLLRMEVLSG